MMKHVNFERPTNKTTRNFFGPRDPILDEILRSSLLQEKMPTIQIDDNAGRILQCLVMLHKPQLIIEIGSLFGYSTIYLARGLSKSARIISFETDQNAAKLAQNNLKSANLSAQAEVVLGDALYHLRSIEKDSVDMVFIDGAKSAYPEYLKAVYPLLRTGGLLIADDIFSDGDYSKESQTETEAELRGIATYNRAVARSPRLFSALIGTETGLMISVKS